MPGTEPGAAITPRSSAAASSCDRQRPARSPQRTRRTGRRNICIDLTFFSRPISGSSTTSLTFTWPRRAVPVTTVPWPRIGKQWSTAKKKGPASSRRGGLDRRRSVSTRASRPRLSISGAFAFLPFSTTAATFSPPTAAAHGTIGASRNLEDASCLRSRSVARATNASRSAAGTVSTLFRAITRSSVVISPITRHSAVCVWMPLFASTTRTIRSMICAPPMMVRMSDAWPGQSTSVYWSTASSNPAAQAALSCSGTGTRKLLKPRSSVMPRAWDCGALSREAVESVVESALTSDVLPLSTCPMMPMLMFSGNFSASASACFFLEAMAACVAQRR
mmetsp:Transcript_10918/g.32592  ORF Transcript_10918/g.32592 Transcript_10918/m.32592 type:complete len:334 (+) Transcript_10918:1136-2137(+)